VLKGGIFSSIEIFVFGSRMLDCKVD
jgi:hypothetical protein